MLVNGDSIGPSVKPVSNGFRNCSAVWVSIDTGANNKLEVDLVPQHREVQINAVELYPTNCLGELILAKDYQAAELSSE